MTAAFANILTLPVRARPQTTGRESSSWKLDGCYLLRTDREDITAPEAWETYTLLTRVETAFRAMKSPLAEVSTTVLPTDTGDVLRIRRGSASPPRSWPPTKPGQPHRHRRRRESTETPNCSD